ncbi:MAG UNVERIFIED_CONTAM: DUF5047 domain-containing protein, partial [Thermobifida fusca]
WSYVWDDHDYGPNNSDGTHPDKANAAQAYRERVPHPPLATTDAIYHAFQVGRIQFVAFDTRYHRSPNSDPDTPSKVMLGSAQRAWLQSVLEASTASALVMLMSSQWLGDSTDSWAAFTHERAAIVEILASTGWAHRAVMVSADAHGIGLISSGANPHGGWPILHCAAIDATPTGGGPQYDLGYQAGRGQYGTLTVSDHGTHIVFTLTGWAGTNQVMSTTYAVAVSSPITVGSAQVTELAPIVRGSHDPVFEARVLTSFQTGSDPDGVQIPILGGDVMYDATAQVFASLNITTAGVDENDQSLFPRLPRDLLAPYGNEIWVRRGVDIGDRVLWVSLGYFRIDNVEQQDSPYGEISISGQDRMAGIIDARLVVPRTFPPHTTVATVFAVMVGEVYPDALIVFDDDTGFASIGNTLTFEEDRYEPLAELANAFGKVMYWDGEGILRVESPPDESQPVMEVNAGSDGVLITSARRVSREGVYNAVVARGEGGEQTDPVFGVAVDIGPNSPTRWGGRFGKVPRFYS